MPRTPSKKQKLDEPPIPPTDIRASEDEAAGQWTFVEFSLSPEAWIEVDDQHVYPLEALE